MASRRTLNVRRIFAILASILSLLALIRWLISSPELPTTLIVSTPWNETFPFHLVDAETLSSSPLPVQWPDRRDFFPTHVIAHPFHRDVFLATNEVQSGSIVALRLVRDSPDPYLVVVGTSDSGGRAPAHCIAHKQSAYCTNYDSTTLSGHDLHGDDPFITNRQTVNLMGANARSHPHQVIPHPRLRDLLLVPDLGANALHILDVSKGIVVRSKVDIPPSVGLGPRHGVVTPDGKHLILGFQNSNSVVSFRIDGRGNVHLATASLPTLPTGTKGQHEYALSDVLLHNGRIYVLNRRVDGPDTGLGDTIAGFELSKGGTLTPIKHIALPCLQPREALALPRGGMMVTCVGREGRKAGLVMVRDERVVDFLLGTASWGIVGVP